MSGVDQGGLTGYDAIRDPGRLQVGIWSHRPNDVNEAMARAVVSFADGPPFWVADSWEHTLVVSTKKSPRSKGTSTISHTVSSKAVFRAAQRLRTNPLSGLMVNYRHPEPRHDGMPWTSANAYAFEDEMAMNFETFCPPAIRNDHRFGPEVWQITCDLVRAGGRLIRGSGWFGAEVWEPFHVNQGFPPSDSTGTGYPYIGCFTAGQVAALGGPTAFGWAPVTKWTTVVNADDEECVVTLLADTFDAVTDELLRDWRAFLAPVLSADAPANRLRIWKQVPNDQSWSPKPVHVLPEDWPT